MARSGKLILPFSEDNVDGFFSISERLANRLSWPRVHWTLLLQQRFSGKALCTYMSLSDNEAGDYTTIKEYIIHVYSLVPEAYRRRFRDLRKRPEQSYLEHAHAMSEPVTCWLRSSGTSTYEQLVELLLVEEFTHTIPR